MDESRNIKQKVLVIEDTPANIDLVRTLLERLGLETFVATTGEKGLELLPKVDPDLVLLDVGLPGIDGFEVCRRIKQEEDHRSLPVIFTTAMADTESIVKGFEVGGVDYVCKPIKHDELVARVTAHLNLRKAHQRLSEQEKFFRGIVEKIPELVFILDAERKITFSNPSFSLLGYEPEELAGGPITDFLELNAESSEDTLFQLATKFVGPLATGNLEVTFKVNPESTISEHVQRKKFLIDAVGIWDVPDEEVFKDKVRKNFLGTLCIGKSAS